MASGIYSIFKGNLFNKEVDLEADTIKLLLLNDSHSFVATHAVGTDVNTNELAATGNYATGGATIANGSVTISATTKWDADNTAWTSATFTAYHGVIHDTSATNSGLICSIDFGGAKTVSSGTFTVQWNAAGILTLATGT